MVYNLTTLTAGNGYIGYLQAINVMADGFLGPTMIFVFGIVLFMTMFAFGQPKWGYFAGCFGMFLSSIGFLSIGLISSPFFYILLVINVMNMLLAFNEQR